MYYPLLYTKYKGPGLCGFKEEVLICFFLCVVSLMEADEPQSGIIFDHRGMIGRVYVGYQ